MNLMTKRFGLVLGGVVGVGAIAALVIGASYALFSNTSSGTSTTFTAGTVSLNSPTSVSCPLAANLEAGDTGTCSFTVNYGGSLPAYIGAEATATGVLAPQLAFSINGTAQPSATPVQIGIWIIGYSSDQSYTAAVDYTLSSDADNSYQGQSAVVTVTFYAVQCSNNGSSDDANESCAETPKDWATSSGVLYKSTIDYAAYTGSMSYEATQLGELGNQITLANGGGPLTTVTVDMANFNVVPSGSSAPITLNIYNAATSGAPGSEIATDTQTFDIPSAPDGGYSGSYCSTHLAADPYCGIYNFDIVFDLSSLDVTLPSTIVYGIEYDPNDYSVLDGTNVQLSTEPTQVSVGADTNPGYVFAALTPDPAYNDVGPGEVTADDVTTTFAQVSTAVDGSDGMAPYVPAVEFSS